MTIPLDKKAKEEIESLQKLVNEAINLMFDEGDISLTAKIILMSKSLDCLHLLTQTTE